MRKLLLLLFALVVCGGSIFAQELKISGKLIAQKDRKPVASAAILLYSQGTVVQTTTSGKDGKFARG